MAKSSERPGASGPDGTAAQREHDGAVQPQADLRAGRVVAGSTVSAAQALATWFGQVQEQQARQLAGWREALAAAQRDIDGAADMQSLATAAAQLASQQFTLALRQVGEASTAWVETAMQLARELQRESAQFGRQGMPGLGVPTAREGAAEIAPLAQFGRMQDEWLATTQRWIDAATGTAHHH